FRSIVGDAVRRDGDGRIGLGDAVAGRAAGVVVVAGAVGEGPGVGRIAAGVGVCRAAEIQAAQDDTAHARGCAGGGMGGAIVGDAVRRDGDGRIGLGDAVAGRAAGVVVVAGAVGEGPGVGRIAAGVGVCRAAEIQAAQDDAAHPRCCAGGGMGIAIVGDAVRRDGDRGIGLGDAVADRAAGVVVVAGAVGEGPGVGRIGAGVGVCRAAEIPAAQDDTAHARGCAGGGMGGAIVGGEIR